MRKVLIVRFSSFGDVVQALSLPSCIQQQWPDAEIHWVTRHDFQVLLQNHPAIKHLWTLDKKTGLLGLLKLAGVLRQQKFSHIYDAHNNLRSRLLCWILRPPLSFSGPRLLRRSIRRWKRFLLFQFRINLFQQPFSGQRDLLEPLQNWGLDIGAPPAPQLFLSNTTLNKVKNILQKSLQDQKFIALAPSAAFVLKRWPVEHWKELIQNNPTLKFILLGGPEDVFLQEIAAVASYRVFDFSGQLSLEESAAVVYFSQALVSNDTGLLHVAEQLGKKAIALMGPAPFGFPSRPQTIILQKQLPCRPCSKHGQGPCVNKVHHECLTHIFPVEVSEKLQTLLNKKTTADPVGIL